MKTISFSESFDNSMDTNEDAITGDDDADNDKSEQVLVDPNDAKKEDLKPREEEGLEGRDLFRCGNAECGFFAEYVADFRDHVAICDFSTDALYLVCYHCQKQSKHVATLVDHLKSHGKFCVFLPYERFLFRSCCNLIFSPKSPKKLVK